MGKALRWGFQQLEIIRWHESDETDAVMEFRDVWGALNFLRRFMSHPVEMMTLRNTVAEVATGVDVSRLTDHEIIQQLAWEVVRGNLRLKLRTDAYQPILLKGVSAGEAAETEVVEPPPPRPEPSKEPTPAALRPDVPAPSAVATMEAPPPVVESTPPPPVDAAAQAATLRQSAELGAPFCET